jgi:hypothetical protein
MAQRSFQQRVNPRRLEGVSVTDDIGPACPVASWIRNAVAKVVRRFCAVNRGILAAFPNSVHPGFPNLAEEKQEEQPATTGSAR